MPNKLNDETFQPFPKLSRLFREVVVSEKLDGTNAQIYIHDDGVTMQCGSRTRWITPKDDNFGFARWCEENKEELLRLGPGHHYGEWVGLSLQRNYGLKERRFYLFNAERWNDPYARPKCCHVVPVLYRGYFNEASIRACMEMLEHYGSAAVEGFMKPEGVVIFHKHSGELFKFTIGGDGHKGDSR